MYIATCSSVPTLLGKMAFSAPYGILGRGSRPPGHEQKKMLFILMCLHAHIYLRPFPVHLVMEKNYFEVYIICHPVLLHTRISLLPFNWR